MKIKIVSSSFVIAALCANLNSNGQPATADIQSQSRDRNDYENSQRHLGKLEKANKIIGMEVTDAQDQKLGKVKDLAIDLQSGRIVEVIVATGGMLGVDEKYVAVPPVQFTCDESKKALQLNVEKDRFKNTPAFKISAWDENVHQAKVTETYQYYNATPYFASDNSRALTNGAAANRLGDVERASKVIGTAVRNPQNEKVGKIENLVVDLPAGRIVEVILATGGFLGMGDELSAIPPQSFQRGGDRNLLVLDTTKEALTSAPHFKSSEWPDLNNPNNVSSVYHSYNVEPYFSTNAVDNTAQNVRDRQNDTLTPLSQGNSESDVDITRQIRKQIIAIDGLSVNGRNVKVITRDGKVTLRGPVNSDTEKHEIADIANKVATQEKVDDQLQIKNDSAK